LQACAASAQAWADEGLAQQGTLPKTQTVDYIKTKTLKRARSLRREMTEAEKRLWGYIRDRRLGGFKFVRQEAIGPFIADFVCRDRKLIVEIDGATHGQEHEVAYDKRRTKYLEVQGFRVIRFYNIDIFKALPDVCDEILLRLGDTP
jgi:very-short-patch-repair endonuclease